jgi:hypothetical protein
MAETATQSGLAAMVGQMPARNQTIADQQRAARMLQLQQAVSRMAPTAAPTAGQAAQLGATAAAAAGEQAVQQAASTLETTGQAAKLGLQSAALAGQQKLGAAQEMAQKEQLGQVERLAAIDAQAKTELFDKELQFRKDAANQTFFSERQLADYKRQAAASDEQFKNWANTAQNYHKRNIASLEAVYNKLAEVERNNFRVGEQQLDQAAKKELVQLKLDTERRLREAKQRAATTAAKWQAAGTIIGVGAGAFFGPTGAAIGGQIGSGLGGIAGAQQAGQEEI